MGGIFRLSELSEVETTIFHFATTIGVLPRMSSPTRGEPYRRRHFREISSSLGGMAVRGEGKKGQRPWRRKEVTRISLPLCTREKTVSQGGPSFSARGAFWHRGCHPPLPSPPLSIANDRSIRSFITIRMVERRRRILLLYTR